VLYPAFSAIGKGREEDIANLSAFGLKHLSLLLGPIVIVCIVLAGPILGMWLGRGFEDRGTLIFQILAAGVFSNSLSIVPDRLIKGVGHPKIIAQLHVSELPFYAGLLYVSIRYWGITGAAVAWTSRAIIEAIIVFVISLRMVPASGVAMRSAGVIRVGVSLVFFAAVLFVARSFFHGMGLIVVTAAAVPLFAAATWKVVLDGSDRTLILAATGLR
jgi:O-antigen/teichoic acid export membrane protein